MLHKTLSTSDNWAGFIARVILGALMLPHGLQKTFGLFGGYGFSGTLSFFTETMKLPAALGAFIILAEFLGSLLLILGFASRLWSLTIMAIVIGAVITVHAPFGFFMNWEGNQGGEGFEYHIALLGLALIVMAYGAGRYSIDKLIISKNQK